MGLGGLAGAGELCVPGVAGLYPARFAWRVSCWVIGWMIVCGLLRLQCLDCMAGARVEHGSLTETNGAHVGFAWGATERLILIERKLSLFNHGIQRFAQYIRWNLLEPAH